MAFTDVTDGSRVIEQGEGMVKVTLAAAVLTGDLLGYNSGWVLADANGTYPAVLVAGEAGASGAIIQAYRAARISGITTGTAGNKLYLSDTAGDYSASAGTYSQVVGVELGGGEIYVEPEDESIGLIDNIALYFGTAKDVSLKWDGSNFEILPVAADTGTFAVGDGTTDMDVKVFVGSATEYVLFDVGNSRVDFGVDATGIDVRMLGDTTGCGVFWDADGDTNGSLSIGASGGSKGNDFYLYGNTNGAYIQWDNSDNALEFVGAATIEIGTSGTPLSYTAGTPVIDGYFTAAGSGSTNLEPIYFKSTVTGTSPVGGRVRFHTYCNVASGGWLNAFKGYMEYGASGSTTGLGSAICAETVLSAGTSSGTYCALEAELVAGAGASAGTATSFIYMNASDAATVINGANGYLFELGAGITDTAGGIFETEAVTSWDATHVLKCRIAGTTYYIPLNTNKAN